MKAHRSLWLLLVFPVVLVTLAALLVIYLSLGSVRTQFDLASAAQASDLGVIEDAAGFSRDIGLIQRQMAAALEGAFNGTLDELQLYRMHTAIVNELDGLGSRVIRLAESELVLDANHNSARGLLQEFDAYRRFVIMSTDVLAVDPQVANSFMEQAQVHFRDFSIFSSRIVALLSERSQTRNAAQRQAFAQAWQQVLLIGLGALLALVGFTIALARSASQRMLDVADALGTLAESESTDIPLPRIEAMHRRSKGEFGRIAATLLAFRDAIELRRKAEAEAFQLAFYDPLTQLPNRRLLLERLRHAVQSSERSGEHAAVLIVDLDEFKRINDTLGHGPGDHVLVEVANRLAATVREGDTVARLSGDEFAILIESLGRNPQQAASAAEHQAGRINAALAAAVVLEGKSLFATASTGIALFDGHLKELDDPLKHAETAMYQAKSDGRDTFRFYDPQMQARLEQRVVLDAELREAIETEQLRLYYQVQVDDENHVRGLEALVRWEHPGKGLISPALFIPHAEESGLILPIGAWVLHKACRQLALWAEHPHRSLLSIAVNVSARQFRQSDFVDQVRNTLRETGAPPKRLKLELTESAVLEDVEATIARMLELRAVGVGFSMDDFGTGYSSLQYLKRLPLNQLKIDQSFVRDIFTDNEDAVIVQTIIAMGHALGLHVIAEGVETVDQRRVLLEHGCRAYQGYLFGRPLPLAELEAWLDSKLVN